MEQWIKLHSAKPEPQQQTFAFAETEVKPKPGEKEWQQFVAMLDGEIGEELRKVEFVSYNGKLIIVSACEEQIQKIEKCFVNNNVLTYVRECFKKTFGKVANLKYSLKK